MTAEERAELRRAQQAAEAAGDYPEAARLRRLLTATEPRR